MSTRVIVVVMIAGVGWYVWACLGRRPTHAASPLPQGMAPEAFALEALTHGHTCVAEGRFDEATAAFQRARLLDPKRPHVADRFAEVARQQ
jgi:hypothetical protein